MIRRVSFRSKLAFEVKAFLSFFNHLFLPRRIGRGPRGSVFFFILIDPLTIFWFKLVHGVLTGYNFNSGLTFQPYHSHSTLSPLVLHSQDVVQGKMEERNNKTLETKCQMMFSMFSLRRNELRNFSFHSSKGRFFCVFFSPFQLPIFWIFWTSPNKNFLYSLVTFCYVINFITCQSWSLRWPKHLKVKIVV